MYCQVLQCSWFILTYMFIIYVYILYCSVSPFMSLPFPETSIWLISFPLSSLIVALYIPVVFSENWRRETEHVNDISPSAAAQHRDVLLSAPSNCCTVDGWITSWIGSLQTPAPRSGLTSGTISASSLYQWNSDSFFRLATCSRDMNTELVTTFHTDVSSSCSFQSAAAGLILQAVQLPGGGLLMRRPSSSHLKEAAATEHLRWNRSIRDVPPFKLGHIDPAPPPTEALASPTVPPALWLITTCKCNEAVMSPVHFQLMWRLITVTISCICIPASDSHLLCFFLPSRALSARRYF